MDLTEVEALVRCFGLLGAGRKREHAIGRERFCWYVICCMSLNIGSKSLNGAQELCVHALILILHMNIFVYILAFEYEKKIVGGSILGTQAMNNIVYVFLELS